MSFHKRKMNNNKLYDFQINFYLILFIKIIKNFKIKIIKNKTFLLLDNLLCK